MKMEQVCRYYIIQCILHQHIIIKHMLLQISHAVQSYAQAIQLLNKHKLWGLILWSGLIYLVLIAAGIWGIWGLTQQLVHSILGLSWVQHFTVQAKYLLWLVRLLMIGLYVASFVVYFSLFKYLLLIIASPLYGYISQCTYEAITGKASTTSVAQFVQDIIRGIHLSTRNILKQSWLTFILLILSFIPMVGLLSAVLLIVLDAYYYGFGMIDYTFERRQLTVAQSITQIKNYRGIAIGNGLVFYALFLIPIIGVVIGAPLSAVAATIIMHNNFKQ
jgi:CysZ protein